MSRTNGWRIGGCGFPPNLSPAMRASSTSYVPSVMVEFVFTFYIVHAEAATSTSQLAPSTGVAVYQTLSTLTTSSRTIYVKRNAGA